MKYSLWIIVSYLGLCSCRSSYDESQKKPEVSTASKASANVGQKPLTPIVETSTPPPASSGLPVSNGSSDAQTSDGLMLATQHDASADELKKYNCKGSARITDSGIDDNKDGVLQDEEIQETRIDCTEPVPGSSPKD